MKTIYKFTINQEVETDATEISKDENGAEIKVTKKVKTQKPRSFAVKKPTRDNYDNASLFYSRLLSEYIKTGVLSANQLSKRYLNDGGFLSEDQKQDYQKTYDQVFTKQKLYSELNQKKESERTKEESEQLTSLLTELVNLMGIIQEYDNRGNSLYNNTAETLAQNQTLRWWGLMLSYEENEPNKYKSFFGDGEYKDRLKRYDEIEENEDPFEFEAIKKLLLVTSLFIMGKAEKKEDFDVLLELGEKTPEIESKTETKESTK